MVVSTRRGSGAADGDLAALLLLSLAARLHRRPLRCLAQEQPWVLPPEREPHRADDQRPRTGRPEAVVPRSCRVARWRGRETSQPTTTSAAPKTRKA
jgi:hypothetical protein